MTSETIGRAAIAYFGGLATLQEVAVYLGVSPEQAFEAIAIWASLERFKRTVRNIRTKVSY